MPFHKPTNHSLLDSARLVNQSRVRVYIVYQDSDHDHWYVRMLKKGYQHVFAVQFDGFFWTKLDFSLGWTDFCVLPYDRYDTIKTILKDQNMTYQYVEAWRKPRYRVRTIVSPWTCVEAMKSVLGIRAWWVLTPWQLYRHLERQNG